MAFRFRKIFKITPGIKINLSKSGISTSIGKAGATVNVGKKGIRKTVGIPGTGLSWSQISSGKSATNADPSKTQPVRSVTASSNNNFKNNSGKIKLPKWMVVSTGVIAMVCQTIFCVAMFTPSTTPTPTIDAKAIQDQAVLTAWANYTLTVAAYSPTPASTDTPIPTATIVPATETPLPTATQVPTALPTATFIFILPTQSMPQSGSCPCSGDTLNCSDFSSRSSAQACFNFCMSQGAGDIHKLDQNNDNAACESL